MKTCVRSHCFFSMSWSWGKNFIFFCLPDTR